MSEIDRIVDWLGDVTNGIGDSNLGSDEAAVILDHIEQLQQQLDRECVWTKTIFNAYGEYDNWATSCGEDFAITEEWHEKPTPFCSNCGGKTKAAIKGESDD